MPTPAADVDDGRGGRGGEDGVEWVQGRGAEEGDGLCAHCGVEGRAVDGLRGDPVEVGGFAVDWDRVHGVDCRGCLVGGLAPALGGEVGGELQDGGGGEVEIVEEEAVRVFVEESGGDGCAGVGFC